MTTVVTLVHGTWASNADWVKEGSALRAEIEHHFRGAVCFRVFHWSGRNTFAARRRAAWSLIEFLNEGLKRFPDSNHVAIAHSHGGNALLHALNDPGLRSRVRRVVCLSTPFINVCSRNFGPFADAVGMGVLWCTAAMAALALDIAMAPIRHFFGYLLRGSGFDALIFFALLTIEVIVFAAGLAVPFKAWRRYAERFEKAQSQPPLSEIDLLVIRSPADEASAALVTSQFLAWIVTGLWRALAAAPVLVLGLIEIWDTLVKEHTRRAVAISLSAMSLLILGLGGLQEVASNWGTYLVVLALGTAFLTVPTYHHWLEFILALVSAVALGVLFLPIALTLIVASMPFGIREALLLGTLQITAEPAPVGKCQILQLGSSGLERGLMHSQSYAHPRALEGCVRWIAEAAGTAAPDTTWALSRERAKEDEMASEEALKGRLRAQWVKRGTVCLVVLGAAFFVVRWELRGRSNETLIERTYVPAEVIDPEPLTPKDLLVIKTSRLNTVHLHVTFQVPVNKYTSGRVFTYIRIYGYRMKDDRRIEDVPQTTFKTRVGAWHAGDHIALDIDVPGQYADPEKGRVVRLGVGDRNGYSPSPNLLAGGPFEAKVANTVAAPEPQPHSASVAKPDDKTPHYDIPD